MLEFLTEYTYPAGPLSAAARELNLWRKRSEEGLIEEAMLAIRQCWTTETFDKPGQDKVDRIVSHFEGLILTSSTNFAGSTTTFPETVNQVMDRLVRHMGTIQNGGPPPRMSTERKLQQFFAAHYRSESGELCCEVLGVTRTIADGNSIARAKPRSGAEPEFLGSSLFLLRSGVSRLSYSSQLCRLGPSWRLLPLLSDRRRGPFKLRYTACDLVLAALS